MEDLTKTQIVLLCLLVSFVTSIGTGIISFSLLQEAPQTVTQTINRVVERTIEKVVPTPSDSKTPTKETTVVVKEEDLVIDAIGKITQSVVRIKAGSGETFYGLGLIVDKEGLIIADRKLFDSSVSYKATLSDGKTYPLTPSQPMEGSTVVFFRIQKARQDTTTFPAATLGNSDTLQLGQSVIAVSGIETMSISTGRVSSLKQTDDGPGQPKYLGLIDTDVSIKDSAMGGPLLNLSGQVVGLNTANTTDAQSGNFTPINLLKDDIAALAIK